MAQPKGMKVVLLMCLGILLCMIDTTIMNVALPAIQTGLHISLEKISWVLNVYTMAIAVLSIPLGRMAEIFGKGKIYVLGLVLFGGASAMCALAASGDFLIFARFLQSVGAAIIFPVSMIIGVSAVPMEKRGMALSLLGLTQGFSAAIGPTIGGIITQNFGWSWVFMVNVPICAIGVLLSFMLLNLKNEQRLKVKIDWLGVLLSSITIFSVTLVLIKGTTWGWLSNDAWYCYIGSAVALILFLIVQVKSSSPMINLKLFRDRLFVSAAITLVLSQLFLIGVTVLLPTFLTRMLGQTELHASLLVTPISGMIFFAAPIASGLIRKIGNVPIIFAGFVIMAVAYYFLKDINVASTTGEIVRGCLLLGLGFGLVVGPITTMGASNFEGELLTASQSVLSMFRQVGIVLAIAIFVSGLTQNLENKKADVLAYAKQQVQTLDVDSSVKDQILVKVQAKTQENGLHGDAVATTNNDVPAVTPEQRDQLIKTNVDAELAKLPVQVRDHAKDEVTTKVTQAVDEKIAKTTSQIKTFSNDMSTYASSTMASAFSDLYKTTVPVIAVASLFSFLFYRRRSSVPANQKSKRPAEGV
jgi:EmrB/QacA subfamily drug resistance transporter